MKWLGLTLSLQKKETNKEKKHIKYKLKKEIDPDKTNLSKKSLLVNNLTTKNIKNNKPLKKSDLESTNKKIDKKHYTDLLKFVFKDNPNKKINRDDARKIKGRK